MAKTLAQIHRQIDTLQRKADSLKRKEAAGVIARIKEAIAFYGLTAADLGLDGRRTRRASASSAAPGQERSARRSVSKVKYRDEHGRTWTGHGRRPKWFLDALASGRTPEDLAA